MLVRYQAHRHARLEGLLDRANLLRSPPAAAALNRRDDRRFFDPLQGTLRPA